MSDKDYIERGAALKLFSKDSLNAMTCDAIDSGSAIKDALEARRKAQAIYDVIASGINSLPAADVEQVVHAYWLKCGNLSCTGRVLDKWNECSNCGFEYGRYGRDPDGNPKRCPNCGAHMDERNEGEDNDTM